MNVYILVLCIFLSVPQTGKNRNQRNPYDNGQGQKAVTAEQSLGASYFVDQQSIKAGEQQYDPYSDSLYRHYLAATVIGVCFSLIVVAMLVWQNILTRQVTKAAQENAEAALLNARAIINAERPWMFIQIKTVAHGNVQFGDIPEHINFSVTFHNFGKTPAEIVGFDDHPDCCKSTDDPDDLPSPPEYSGEGQVLTHTRMIPAEKDWDTPVSYTPHDWFTGEQWNDIRASRKRLVYWGRLQYRDLIEEPKSIHELKRDKPITIHETCFCYFWSPVQNEFLITGPNGYNKHT
jgi:hypothetical protein